MYACLYRPPQSESPSVSLAAIAQEFSPRYECHRDDLVSIDVSGLERLFRRRSVLDTPERDGARALASGGGAPRSVWKTIGEELRRDASSRGMRVHVAVAGTRMAAIILAHARPGVTIVEPGGEAEALAPIAIGVLEKAPAAMPAGASATRDAHARHQRAGVGPREKVKDIDEALESALAAFKAWGLKTLGELAALPSADLASRLGRQALVWQALARGEDVRPLRLAPRPALLRRLRRV